MVQAGTPAGAGPTAQEVDAALEAILARPEYAPAEPPIVFRWIGAALRWIGERISSLLEPVMPEVDFTGPGWATFGHVLLGLGGFLGLALLVYLFYLASQAVRRRRRRSGRAGATAEAQVPVTVADWEALARGAAAREDWRGAAMALYQAVLLRLARVEVVVLDRAKTPGDYRRDVRRRDGELATRFEAFLHGFERIAYGAGAPGPDQYDRLTESAARLVARG